MKMTTKGTDSVSARFPRGRLKGEGRMRSGEGGRENKGLGGREIKGERGKRD